MQNTTIEVAVDQLDHAIQAEQYGASRIELCAHLSTGGSTPNYGLIQACVQQLSIPIHVMLRCRTGDFHYTEQELGIMIADAEACAKLGATGVVFGFLNKDHSLNLAQTKLMLEKCKNLNLKTTFHRAIDVCKKPDDTIATLCELGVDNLLTSGTQQKAIDGISTIEAFVNKFGNDINIMAGSGVNSQNAKQFLQVGVDAIHFTSYQTIPETVSKDFAFGDTAVFDKQKLLAVIKSIR